MDPRKESITEEIKGLVTHFKVALKEREVWDSEVEFQRQNIRNKAVTLLFNYSQSSSSNQLDHPLWIETTHVPIQAFRAKLSKLEVQIKEHKEASREHKSYSKRNGGGNNGGGPPSGTVEFRKTLQKFKVFLNKEIEYWTGLIVRIIRAFGLLTTPCLLGTTLETLGIDIGPPQQDNMTSGAHFDQEESWKKKKTMLVHKALVCVGDLERYKEIWNEKGKTAGKAQHYGQSYNAGRKFERSVKFYKAALALVPDNGNPSSQLAVLSTHQGNVFLATYYSFRSLAVRVPFPTARINLSVTLKRAHDLWRKAGYVSEGVEDGIVVVHAIAWLKSGVSKYQAHSSHSIDLLREALKSRALTPEAILQVVSMAFAAHWDCRVTSKPLLLKYSPNTLSKEKEKEKEKEEGKGGKESEALLVDWVTRLIGVIFEVSVGEMDNLPSYEPTPTSGFSDSEISKARDEFQASLVTAVLRRLLPTLRLISKWFLANTTYITHNSDLWTSFYGFFIILQKSFPMAEIRYSSGTCSFWEDAEMRGFGPIKKLMDSDVGADSDNSGHPNAEMLARIGALVEDGIALSTVPAAGIYLDSHQVFLKGFRNKSSSELQPNPPLDKPVSQVYRAISATAPPFVPSASKIAAATAPPPLDRMQVSPEPQSESDGDEEVREDDAELGSVSTETEDDPVNRAMRAALDDGVSDDMDDVDVDLDLGFSMTGVGGNAEEEDEHIIWSGLRPAAASHPAHKQPQNPPPSIPHPQPHLPVAPVNPAPVLANTLTASDLLIAIYSSPNSLATPASTGPGGAFTPPSNLLFGAGNNNDRGSIWGNAPAARKDGAGGIGGVGSQSGVWGNIGSGLNRGSPNQPSRSSPTQAPQAPEMFNSSSYQYQQHQQHQQQQPSLGSQSSFLPFSPEFASSPTHPPPSFDENGTVTFPPSSSIPLQPLQSQGLWGPPGASAFPSAFHSLVGNGGFQSPPSGLPSPHREQNTETRPWG